MWLTVCAGVATYEVGEIKDRFQDALCATRCALEEGIVPGGIDLHGREHKTDIAPAIAHLGPRWLGPGELVSTHCGVSSNIHAYTCGSGFGNARVHLHEI